MARTKHRQRKNSNFKRSLQPIPLGATEENMVTPALPIRARQRAPDVWLLTTPSSLSSTLVATSISPLALALPQYAAQIAWFPVTDVDTLDWSSAKQLPVCKDQNIALGMNTMMCISFEDERPKYLQLKYQDHPDLPANSSLNHVHLIDMSEFCNSTIAIRLCLANAVATLLFHWDPKSVKHFFDVDASKNFAILTTPNKSQDSMKTAVGRTGKQAVVGLYKRVGRKRLLWDSQVRFHIHEGGEWLPQRGFVNGVTCDFEHDPHESVRSSTFAAIRNEHEIRQLAKKIAVYILVNLKLGEYRSRQEDGKTQSSAN